MNMYPAGLAAAQKAAADFDANDRWYVVLVKGTFAYNAAHVYYSEIAAGRVAGQDPRLLNDFDVTVAGALVTYSASNPAPWLGVADPDQVGAAVVFYNTGDPATSPLFAFCDGTNLTTTGVDVTLAFDAAGIATLDLS